MTTSSKTCPKCGQEINNDYLEIKDGKKTFRIYEWDKSLEDFPMPKGFRLAEEREFIDLYDNDKINLEKYPVIYFTKNRSKKNVKNGWGLSRLFLDNDFLYLVSYNDILTYSYVNGRVVIVKK
jgi:hypothetical protein